ncbi:hypothetical protein LX15_000375 [Streptoalloteichus tenebrarius]|uniref:Uncharacterized protein n=1 Tax=Streptoalloteichus tenebrarius (strain ATCC 17920 / DSM 40477 / JCM 4838 / CBS 697.72 / NBRC 16177 / NCIMB 11028 / NRRL B-12390 / A12253. 1 / ISP 5477) TaxID=1933 RepID=A0ABT1HME2_STRSD|nr:hypothetical protein [Streptoalloteichus tenebrarius]
MPVLAVAAVLAVNAGLLARNAYQDARDPQRVAASDAARAAQSGDALVQLSPDAFQHPDGQAVRELLDRYFRAINDRNYGAWRDTVVDRRALAEPEHQWRAAYRSTRDGAVVVRRIETAQGEGLRVLLTFTSNQDPADAPVGTPVSCLRWRVVYAVVVDDGRFRVGMPLNGSTQRDPC